jgi:hypothetical protein
MDGRESTANKQQSAISKQGICKMTKELDTTKGKGELVTAAEANAMPAFMQGAEVARIEGTDASDMIIPRLKLLQGISPEVEAFEEAKSGQFWHNVLNQSIGNEFEFIVIKGKKKYLLMAPMNDPRGVLARSEDAVTWNPPNAKFEVKLKGVKEPQIWETKPTVVASGLAEFGSSVKDDPDSKPAAVLIYEYLVYLRNFPQLSPVVLSLARSQAKRGKDLNSKISFRNAPLAGMVFKAVVTEEVGDEGPYKNIAFQNSGWATEAEFEAVTKLQEQFKTYKVADEEGALREGETATDASAGAGKEY